MKNIDQSPVTISKKPDSLPKSADPNDDNFCWFLFLEQPDDEITEEQIEEAYDKSTQWVTCACGQVCAAIPRNQFNEPDDETLYELGMNFMFKLEEAQEQFYIRDSFRNCLNDAKDILVKIEQRTTELLKQNG